MTGQLLRSTALALWVMVAVFAFSVLLSMQRGAEEMLGSDRAFDAGELELAVRHARRAATLYVPGAEHVARAYERLRAVAIGAERARDRELARIAWRAMRAAANETRHLWATHPGELEDANMNLARLSNASNTQVAVADGAEHASSALPALGFSVGLAALLLMCWSGMSKSGRISWASVRLPAAVLGAGLVSFFVALIRA